MRKQKAKAAGKKVFFLTNSLEIGGAERVIAELEPFLSKRYDLRIISIRKPREGKNVRLTRKPVHLLGAHSDLAMMLGWPLAAQRLRRLISKERPLRVVSFLELSNFMNIIVNQKGEAVISFRTSMGFFRGLKGMLYKLLIRLLYRKAKRIVFNSEENKEAVLRMIGFRRVRGSVARNPFNMQKIRALSGRAISAREQKMLAGKKVFVSIGRLNNEKNWDSLVLAFKSAVRRDKRNVLVVLGDGYQRAALQDLADHEGLSSNVFFLGQKENVFPYLKRADYFIFDSPAEGFPNALIEAAACGVPIITNDFRTGAREIIDPKLGFREKVRYPYFGPNGVLFRTGDYGADLARAWPRLKSLKQKQAGLERFRIENVIREWIRIIEDQES